MKNIGEAVTTGQRSMLALSVVVGIAVLREGSEIVLFLYGIAISGNDTATTMALGGMLGLVLGVAVGAVTYSGLARIPNRYLFSVTGWLITLLAAGMAAQAVAFLQQADILTAFSQAIWNTSRFLSDGSLGGQVLHTLVGYTDRPTGMQFIGYSITLAAIFVLMRLFGHSATARKKLAPEA
jgi:high-affinity iron transporter